MFSKSFLNTNIKTTGKKEEGPAAVKRQALPYN
jgi:hypothetical protein